MNLYFWLFALYALLITPVGMQAQVRIDRGIHYCIRLRAAGLPFLWKKKEEERQKEIRFGPDALMNGMKNGDAGLLFALLKQGHMTRLFRLFHWHDLEVRVRISFEDAALTAMTYALIRTVLQSVAPIRSLPVKGGVEMNFHGTGSTLSFRCIADTRLGNLVAAAIRLWAAIVSYRAKRLKLEEEQYAASSH